MLTAQSSYYHSIKWKWRWRDVIRDRISRLVLTGQGNVKKMNDYSKNKLQSYNSTRSVDPHFTLQSSHTDSWTKSYYMGFMGYFPGVHDRKFMNQIILDHWTVEKLFTSVAFLRLGPQQDSSTLIYHQVEFSLVKPCCSLTQQQHQHRVVSMERLQLPAQQGWQDHCMFSIVHWSCVCVCVCVCRVCRVCNGGAGALHSLPRVRREQERHRGAEEVRRERKSKREREMGGGVTTTGTHAHIHARNTVTPLPHRTHIHASEKRRL